MEGGTSTHTTPKGKRMRMEREPLISFDDEEANDNTHDDPLSISMWISTIQVKRVIVDIGSAIDILFIDTFRKLGLTRNNLCPTTSSLTRLTSQSVSPLRTVTLHATFGEEPRDVILLIEFIVIDIPLALQYDHWSTDP
ncbi:hypothetical protein B296_00035200 [Ensete ventricosum]|uniref:Uncharacterized protein n=1 Tax=Ensete ventricosum TaxID=4639 RepID=A0A426ZRZ7_ENSVE|nr:hypothetical protein B296_00035200 [Ensete ventricosum]